MSGHGKGVPDGVGGALKRTANNLVLHGHDISDAASFVCKIQEQDESVYLYEIYENEILNNSDDAKLNLLLEPIKFIKSKPKSLANYSIEM